MATTKRATGAKATKAAKAHTEVEVDHLFKCDFCEHIARYDGKTGFGGWANMCTGHFYAFGIGLGLGKGQKRVLKKEVAE